MIDIQPLSTPALPLTAAQLRAWMRLNDDSEDSILEELIAAAVIQWEEKTACPVIHTQYRQSFDKWASPLVLARSNVVSVQGLFLRTSATDYGNYPGYSAALGSSPARLILDELPTPPKWVPAGYVEFTAGLAANAAGVPKDVLVALKQLVSHWYENRDAYTEKSLKEVPSTWTLIATRRKLGLSGPWGQK